MNHNKEAIKVRASEVGQVRIKLMGFRVLELGRKGFRV